MRKKISIVTNCLNEVENIPLFYKRCMDELAKHPELPRELGELAEYSDMSDPDAVDKSRRFKWSGDEVIVNFGKYAGRPLREIAENEPGFLRWIIKNDFPDDVREIAGNALIGKFPERKHDGNPS